MVKYNRFQIESKETLIDIQIDMNDYFILKLLYNNLFSSVNSI